MCVCAWPAVCVVCVRSCSRHERCPYIHSCAYSTHIQAVGLAAEGDYDQVQQQQEEEEGGEAVRGAGPAGPPPPPASAAEGKADAAFGVEEVAATPTQQA